MSRRMFVFAVVVSLCLASTLAAATRSWTGASSANWSDSGNWSPAGTPQPTDALFFPDGASHQTMTNDLPAGTNVGAMNFGASYTINGNPLTLTGNLTFDPGAITMFMCNADLKLASPVTLGKAMASQYHGAIDVNGQVLTIDAFNTLSTGPINGSGSIVILNNLANLFGGGSFSGSVTGVANVAGSMPNGNFSGPSLTGSGTVGTVSMASVAPGDYTTTTSTFGVLHTSR